MLPAGRFRVVGAPSPQPMSTVKVSFVPASVMVPLTVAVPLSSIVSPVAVAVGATLLTVTVAV